MKTQQISRRQDEISSLDGRWNPVQITLWKDSKGLFYTAESEGIEMVTVRVIGNASIDGLYAQMQRRLVRRELDARKEVAA